MNERNLVHKYKSNIASVKFTIIPLFIYINFTLLLLLYVSYIMILPLRHSLQRYQTALSFLLNLKSLYSG